MSTPSGYRIGISPKGKRTRTGYMFAIGCAEEWEERKRAAEEPGF
jgi:hypothetical protein